MAYEKDGIEPVPTHELAIGAPTDHHEKEKASSLEGEVDVKAAAHDPYMTAGTAVEEAAKGDLEVTADDLLAAEEKLSTMSLERCRAIMFQVRELHRHDQNFSSTALERINLFLDNPEIAHSPMNYPDLITEMKLEALLVTENSPYAEVRAVVDNTDDPTMPAFTFRVWVIGIIFAGAGAFINQLFFVRNPAVYVTANVAQLLSYPAGKLMAAIVPASKFTVRGKTYSLNPGPFNKKEHMLITIMATVAYNTPYTGYTVITTALPVYFNRPYAYNYGFQLLSSLGSNFVGYGLAGLCRRFLVFPSFCIWPSALVTVALNKAFHTETNEPVAGPFGRNYTWSRQKFFLIAFCCMFFYWWFPGFIFTALSYFNWINWIAPNNVKLSAITGTVNGLGVNPWPTFDFNNLTVQGWVPLVLPTFTILNQFIGMIIGFFMIVGIWFSNAWETGYLPINSNKLWDNTGARYNVSNIVDAETRFVEDGYQNYSMVYMAAGNLVIYFWFFAIYTATISYAFLFHRHDIALGFKGLWRTIRPKKVVNEALEDDLAEDIHIRLMRAYREVPEWWYLSVLVIAAVLGMVGVGAWPTYTSPAVIVFGVVMAVICIIPVGMITAVTGIQVTMNVLAEFLGGAWVQGNALAMNYFKMYGYIATAQAVYFSSDLKLAHYTKIPPRATFSAQIIATLVSTLVCTSVFNFQMGFDNVCTSDAAFGMTCPGENTFFTASIFWGTLGPQKLFGKGARYNMLLLGFPVGFVLPFIMWGLRKKFPKVNLFRQLHPVMICAGGLLWSPYNFGNFWPVVPLTLLSWVYIKRRYLAFWSKYNYVLAAAWMAAIAICAIVIFFGIQIPGKELDWWGNAVTYSGCEDVACPLLEIPDVGYFGPAPGSGLFH